jgi:hypothetical protein
MRHRCLAQSLGAMPKQTVSDGNTDGLRFHAHGENGLRSGAPAHHSGGCLAIVCCRCWIRCVSNRQSCSRMTRTRWRHARVPTGKLAIASPQSVVTCVQAPIVSDLPNPKTTDLLGSQNDNSCNACARASTAMQFRVRAVNRNLSFRRTHQPIWTTCARLDQRCCQQPPSRGRTRYGLLLTAKESAACHLSMIRTD